MGAGNRPAPLSTNPPLVDTLSGSSLPSLALSPTISFVDDLSSAIRKLASALPLASNRSPQPSDIGLLHGLRQLRHRDTPLLEFALRGFKHVGDRDRPASWQVNGPLHVWIVRRPEAVVVLPRRVFGGRVFLGNRCDQSADARRKRDHRHVIRLHPLAPRRQLRRRCGRGSHLCDSFALVGIHNERPIAAMGHEQILAGDRGGGNAVERRRAERAKKTIVIEQP